MGFENAQLASVETAATRALPPFVESGAEVVFDKKTLQTEAEAFKQTYEQYGLTGEEMQMLFEYSNNFNIDQADFEGKFLLDVGAAQGKFARAIEKLNLDTKVVSLDRDKLAKASLGVVGQAETLPFADESFDGVLAHCSVPIMHFTSGSAIHMGPLVSEMLRVVKNNGTVRIYPALILRSENFEPMREKYEALNGEMVAEVKRLHERFPEYDFYAHTVTYLDDGLQEEQSLVTLEIRKKQSDRPAA